VDVANPQATGWNSGNLSHDSQLNGSRTADKIKSSYKRKRGFYAILSKNSTNMNFLFTVCIFC
jgi:hypothetical protein